jgi:adenylate cyclase
MYGQLVPCGGGNPVALLKPRLVVGRAADCDLPISSGTVSSKHCLLEQRDGVWFVTDLASRNGIRIDGVRCQEGRLPPGSVLWIAQQRFQVEYAIKGGETRTASRSVSAPAPASKPAAPPRESDTSIVELPGSRKAHPVAQPPSAPPLVPKSGVSLGELIPCGGGVPIPLLKPSLIVGRSPACDITLAFPMISSKHCQLEFKSGFWHVRDLGSRNGIRVDGIVQLAKYLKPGEILSIARHRYEIAYTPLADEAPPEENPFALSLLEKAGLAGRGLPVESRLPSQDAPASDDWPVRKKWTIDE